MQSSSPRSVRIQLRWITETEQDVLLDVHLDADDRIAGSWPVFGRLKGREDGPIKEYPLSLSAGGVIIFSPDDTGYSTNVRERVIKVDELCTIWGDEERGVHGGTEWTYRISSVHALGTPLP